MKNGTAFGEGEIAICSTHKSVRIFEYTWNGMIQQFDDGSKFCFNVDVNTSKIRFWCRYFGIDPIRRHNGDRRFTAKELDRLKLIQMLTEVNGLKLWKVKEVLRKGK